MPRVPAPIRNFYVWLQQAKQQGKPGTGSGTPTSGSSD